LLKGTEVGRQSGLDGCKSLDDCRRLAVSDDVSVRPLFQRVFQQGAAARSLMGRSRLVGFARTSGTQGDPKDVPMNAAYVASLDRTLTAMVASRFYTNGEWDSMLTGRQILLGSRPRSGTSPTGLPISDISGFIPTRTWRSMRWAYIPRHADLWIADWSQKAERILEQARGKNVVSLVGIPALAADFAARAKTKFGVKYLDEVWPNLHEYIFGAVHLSAAEKARITREWFGPGHTLRFHETYISTEGPLAFSFDARDDGLALNTLENLYLFRPYSAPDTLLFADELREGQAYSIHVTTPGGLVNFRMGDRVEITSTKPLLVRVVGRESDELSMTGEKITLAQVDLALEAAGLGPARLGPCMPAVWVELADCSAPGLGASCPRRRRRDRFGLRCEARRRAVQAQCPLRGGTDPRERRGEIARDRPAAVRFRALPGSAARRGTVQTEAAFRVPRRLLGRLFLAYATSICTRRGRLNLILNEPSAPSGFSPGMCCVLQRHRLTSAPRMIRISASARRMPMQERGPAPKGR
jgi:hypothetical protein